jgi:protein SCO1/2
MATFWKPFGVSYQFVPEEQPAKTDWWTGKPLTYDVVHTDGYIIIDASGHERFVNASAPNIPNLSPKLKALLNEGGVQALSHPEPTSWTTADVLTALSWVLGTNVAAPGS